MNWKLSQDWSKLVNNREIILYGFGKLCKLYFPKLSLDFEIKYIVDNAPSKNGLIYEGVPVVNFEKIKEELNGKKIVIVVGTNIAENARQEIKNYLKEQGLTEYEDFCDIEEFAIEWYWRFEQRLNIFQIHTAVTTSCSLRCQNCNMMIPWYKIKCEYTEEDIAKNLELLFKGAEYVFKYQLVGGEPFLNKNLNAILDCIKEKYNDLIGWKRIITNGTIIPNETTLAKLKEANFEVVISDYSDQVDYKNKIELLEEKLQSFCINYVREKELTWVDVGLPDNIGKAKNEHIKEHMKNCASSWHGLADGKLYYCNLSWSAEKAGFHVNEKGDYIDLTEEITEESLLEIVKLQLGEIDKGYNSLCQYCNGCGTNNNRIIPAGNQMKG